MAVKPPKQFCGDEHWSGEACKKCDAIKARKFPVARVVEAVQVALGPCAACAVYERTIEVLTAEVAKLQGKVFEQETKTERERSATLERVRQYRARKARA